MSAVKALQQWCKIQCNGYRDVSITNMTTSFRDGLAFCAMIHKYRPELINFDSLKKDDVYENNKLAFRVAEEELGIPALLDAEDMVALKVPDRLSILTYVSQYYNYFHGRSPIGGLAGVKRPAEDSENEPSGKKNMPVVARLFPASKPVLKNHPPASSSIIIPGSLPARPSPAARKEAVHENPSLSQTGTLSNKCVSCYKLVHLVERHLVDGKLYHRNCAKATLKANAPLRDLLQKASSSKQKSHSETPEPGESTSAPFNSDSSWLTTKKQPSSSPGLVSSKLNNKMEPSSSPSPAPSKTLNKMEPSSSPSPAPSKTLNKMEPSSSPSPAPSKTLNKMEPSSSPSPAPSKTLNKMEPSSSPSPAPSKTLNKMEPSSSPSPAPSKTPNKMEPSSSPSPAPSKTPNKMEPSSSPSPAPSKTPNKMEPSSSPRPALSGLTNKAQQSSSTTPPPSKTPNKMEPSSSPSPAPSWTTNKMQHSSSPSPALSGLTNKAQQSSSPSPAPSWITKKTVSTAPPSTSGPALITTSTRANKPSARPLGTTTTYNTSINTTINPTPTISTTPLKSTISTNPIKTSKTTTSTINTSINATPVKIIVNTIPMETTPITSRPTATPRTSSVAQRTQQAKLRFFQKEPEGLIMAGKDIESATKDSPWNKNKPDHIPKEKIMEELQEIEEGLNELEKQGVELEKRLRRSEEEGEEDAAMDEVMVDWFNLIREKQVAMRRESELVYIAKTQDLEEQQPSVEQELRRLMEKPDNAKTYWERQREKELMAKLVEIVNDRNAIVEGLDEDRLREEEEDEQLQQLMMNLDIKKDKTKKKSPMSKLFGWGNNNTKKNE
ncbi:unnamed protein product [Lota lota]